MTYASLRDELSRGPSPKVVAFPDGSVDTFSSVRRRDGVFDSVADFERELAAGRESFQLEPKTTAAGGQAVNMATQVHALGARTELYGHLDDPTLSDLPFSAVSMGDPADVSVLELGDDAVIVASESASIRDWTAEDLRTAMGGDFAPIRAADGVCCGNLASFPALLDVVRSLGAGHGNDGVFVLDPGDLHIVDDDTLAEYFDALGEMDGFAVVLSVNRAEMVRLGELVGARNQADETILSRIRDESSVSAVVFHGKDRAIAATRDGAVAVPNQSVSNVERTTGAGDRFSGGLTFGLASGWEWETTLALANVCTSYYVETTKTVDKETITNEEWGKVS